MTINEIAEMAGVSRATVSRYLNHGYVSQEKRERIKEAIEKTGYQPSTQAQTLRTKKTKLVGVILPKISSDTVSRMVAGISDVLSKRGYQLLLANTNNDIEEELKYLNLFKDNQVDGILFIATIFSARHKKILKECRVPVVILGQRLDGFSCVYQDDFHAALQITERMLRHGRIPAYIGVTDRDEAAGLSRRKGFEAALAAAGIPMRPELMVEGDFSIESGSKNMQSLLEKEPKLDCGGCRLFKIRRETDSPGCAGGGNRRYAHRPVCDAGAYYGPLLLQDQRKRGGDHAGGADGGWQICKQGIENGI